MFFYEIAYANTEITKWSEDCIHEEVFPQDAKRHMDDLIEDILFACGVVDYICCISSDTNWRYEIMPYYKANRDHKEKPKLHKYLKDYCMAHHPWEIFEDLEADDTMGILSTREVGRYVICSRDKDLRQIEGWHYNWHKEDHPVWVDRFDGHRFHMKQTLMGDPVDGYCGVPRVGEKKADKILDSVPPEDWWEAIVATYETCPERYALAKYGKPQLGEEDALQQARVSHMLTHEYYKNGEVILWTPS
jgi:DNA polymerase-1